MKSWPYRLAGILVSILFVYLAVRRVDVAESLRTLKDVQPLLLGIATLVYLASFPVLALRWRLILRAQKVLSWRELMVPLFVGYMVNKFVPAGSGEIYRAHSLGRRMRMSRSGVAASISTADYSATKDEYRSDAFFVEAIDHELPPQAEVFQLPYVPFPEHPPVHEMTDYDHLRPFTCTKATCAGATAR
jgi:hypothetical protein